MGFDISIIAASENQIGILGAAPKAQVYSLKVLDDTGIGSISTVINAIDWCIQNNINIINMSFGTNDYSKALEKEIKLAYKNGVLLVGSAGNNGEGATDDIQYPAAYADVIAVGAVDRDNQVASFSSRGDKLELCAPGVEVYSTSLGKGYGTSSGTSFSAPHVAAVAALLWGKDETKSNEFIRTLLDESAQDLGAAKDYGNGLVDGEQALNIYVSVKSYPHFKTHPCMR